MAPIRRYLRITKYSVLEVRIYLDNPALAQSWLLNPRYDILPRIIQAVRPLVLPKLREENERAKAKGGKKIKKGVKDVVHDDDFEVSIFLTDVPTRHSLLTKQKQFMHKTSQIKSNSGKLTNWLTSGTNEKPIDIDLDGIGAKGGHDDDAVVIREESDDEGNFGYIAGTGGRRSAERHKKRPREDSDEGLFVNDNEISEEEEKKLVDTEDDKKKLSMKMSYDGFSIYGRVLCLVVRKKETRGKVGVSDDTGQQMLETWVSTQAAQEQTADDE